MSTTVADRPCLDQVASNRWVITRYLAAQAVAAVHRAGGLVRVFLTTESGSEASEVPDYGAVELAEGTKPSAQVMSILCGAAAVDRHGRLLDPGFGLAPFLLNRDWILAQRLALDNLPGSPLGQVLSRVPAAVRFVNHHRQAVELVATLLSEKNELDRPTIVELVRLAEQPEQPPARAER